MPVPEFLLHPLVEPYLDQGAAIHADLATNPINGINERLADVQGKPAFFPRPGYDGLGEIDQGVNILSVIKPLIKFFIVRGEH